MSLKSALALGLIVVIGGIVYIGPEQMRETLSGVHLFVQDFNIEEKNAVIDLAVLPIIKVIPFQIEQLFINLISNS